MSEQAEAPITQSSITKAVKTIWWLILLRGVFAIIFGVIILITPVSAVTTLVIVFGVFSIVDGILSSLYAVTHRKQDLGRSWGWVLVQGILSILVGIVAVSSPLIFGAVALFVLLWFVIIEAFINGFGALINAFDLRGKVKGWGWHLLGAIILLALAVWLLIIVLTNPQTALVGFLWVIAVFAIISGVGLIIAAIATRTGFKNLKNAL